MRGFVRKASDLVNPRAAKLRNSIEEAYVKGEWERVADIVPKAMKYSITLANPGNYLRLAQALARLRRNGEAAQALENGVAQYPWSQVLLRGAAEFAMSQGKWSTALLHWQRALDAPEQDNEARSRVRALPRRGTDFDWYELAWRNIANGWREHWEEAHAQPLPITYSRVHKVLQVCGETELATHIAVAAIRDFPENEELLLEMLPSLSDSTGIGSALDTLLSRMEISIPGHIIQKLREASQLIDSIQELGTTGESELRILTVRKHSPYETVVRASNVWDEHRIQRATRNLAERDSWPEREATTDRLSDAAWVSAKRFASGRGNDIGVEDTSLAKAVFHMFKHELVLKLPVDRLAQEIAAESGERPILLVLNSLTLRYLDGYPGSVMHVFYLYDALRRLGANAQLMHFVHRSRKRRGARKIYEPVAPTLTTVPVVTGLRPGNEELTERTFQSTHLLVPSGIRSVTRVLNQLDEPPVVLSSGSALSDFAYDRTKMHRISYDVHANLHPGFSYLPRYEFGTSIKQVWRGVDQPASQEAATYAGAWISTGIVNTKDWDTRFAEVILPYFAELVRNIDEFITENGITDVHIGDYLYAEPALVADRARALGGRVHLWPHSSNPVHVKYHDVDQITSIHCVTASGAAIWKEIAPNADIRHEPALMLPNHGEPVQWEPGEPLSLVVMGGRPVMRHLPILAIEQHEQVYRDFFNGLQPLVNSGKLRVYFKPRGLSGEHEAWLEDVVGRAADWKRELAHPLRLKLSNPVYASVSVGSSALLEGVARGIPGLIVKGDLHVRDYISTQTEGLAVMDVEASVEFLESLVSGQTWETTREYQRVHLADELGIPVELQSSGAN